jgi:hypothetical protein
LIPSLALIYMKVNTVDTLFPTAPDRILCFSPTFDSSAYLKPCFY